MMEYPLTVSESLDDCVPRTLEYVIGSLQDLVGIPSRHQLISALFYILMQECGFVLRDTLKNNSDVSEVNFDKNGWFFNIYNLIIPNI